MIICKDCRCFHPVTVSDRYCGDCCIGDTKDPIAINADITECCLFEPKQPKKPKPLTNADRIRQMTDEELAEMVSMKVCRIVKPDGKDCPKGFYFGKCDKCVIAWLKQEVQNDAGT